MLLLADVAVLTLMAFGTRDWGFGIWDSGFVVRDPGFVVRFATVMNVMCDKAIRDRLRGEHVGRVKHRLTSKRANAGLAKHILVAAYARLFARVPRPSTSVAVRHGRGCKRWRLPAAAASVLRLVPERTVRSAAILEQLDRLAQAGQQLGLIGSGRGAARTHADQRAPHSRAEPSRGRRGSRGRGEERPRGDAGEQGRRDGQRTPRVAALRAAANERAATQAS